MTPRPEYPRPDRDRSQRWLSLNGTWDLETSDGDAHRIVVPFAWESAASGVGRTWLERATYRREVTMPTTWAGSRVVLCFGAVHHRAVVAIDEQVVADHTGGHTAFEVDVTEALSPGVPAVLTVAVDAPADKRAIPHGKQRSIPRDDYDGVCFTPTSGIWQPVWLEARGRTYAESVVLRGDSLTGLDVQVDLAGDQAAGTQVEVAVLDSGETITLTTDGGGRARGRLDLASPRRWTPSDPHLYRLRIRTGDDELIATTGLRRIETRGEELYLNGERLYVRGVLDQGYWPETGLTAPDADALRRDLQLARDLGYNLVRKHLKLEEPLWLHEADQMGMLVWAEPPCTSRFSAAGVEAFEAQLAPMVERDGNHPSIVIWGLYNEEWGLDWDIPGSAERAEAARHAYELMHSLDDTRPIVENSGWSHVRTDLLDWHYYEPDLATWRDRVAALAAGEIDDFPVRLGPDFVVDKSLYGHAEVPRTGVPILNSEYGEGFTSLERAWHLRWETQELRRHDRFAGYVYTELTDIEHESAGLLDAARQGKDWGGCRPADVNATTVLVLDLVPLAAGADIEPPAAELSLTLQVSHHGPSALTGRVHAAWVPSGTPVDRLPGGGVNGAEIVVEPHLLSEASVVTVPARPTPGRLLLWFADAEGTVHARAFLDAAEVEKPNRRGGRAETAIAPYPPL